MNTTQIPWLIAALLLTAACSSGVPGEGDDTASACPPVTDPCMNEENHQACLDVEASCDGSLSIMESCPLQFGCED